MADTRQCPHCGTELAAEAAAGLCPRCLIALNLTLPTDPPSDGAQTRPQNAPNQPHTPRGGAPSPEEIGRFFPQLEIQELLGKGGMGAVYKARQRRLDRVVALKILPPNVSSEPAFAERFTREAQALAKLNHPNIVALYEFGQADGLFYFLMEFVDGLTLRKVLNAGRLAPKEALAIVPQICEALQFAHQHGIVHRDIKPENILLSKDGQVKIADFGVAKIVTQSLDIPAGGGVPEQEHNLTQANAMLGTPQYMAPEQVSQPLEVDHRADIFSLGVVFYQLLTGELPTGKVQPPSRKVVIDVRLDEVVMRALEKEPERRYQHVGELKTMVETIAATLHIGTSVGLVQPPRTSTPRWWKAAAFAGVSLLIALGLLLAVAPSRKANLSPAMALDPKLDATILRLSRTNTPAEEAVNLLGEPERYFWGKQSFNKGNLPETFIMAYPYGVRVVVSRGKIMELRSEEPGPGFGWGGTLRLGSSLEEVQRVVGEPARTAVGEPLLFDPGVLYRDIGGQKGYCYYGRPDQHIRFFFQNYRLCALYVTVGESEELGAENR